MLSLHLCSAHMYCIYVYIYFSFQQHTCDINKALLAERRSAQMHSALISLERNVNIDEMLTDE